MVSLRTLALALLAFLWSPSLLTAQSVLQFPRAISSSGVFTGLAVGNPTTTEASVTFVAFQADGTLLAAGAQNPVTVIIPAGGQYARLIPEIFGSVNFNGWIQATSSTSGLTGFFLNGNSALTDFDGAGSKAPGTDFILPIAVEDATARTEVTLVNVNPDAAVATVTLYANDGRVILTKAIALAARSLERQTLVNLLGAIDYSAASHLAVRANRPIIAHEVVADFQFPGTGLRRETAALSGHALTSTASHVLPQFATGGDWTSVVGLVNGSNVAQNVTLTAYKEDGSIWNLPSNPKQVTLPGNGGIRETVENLFGFPSSTLNSGWIQVSPSQGPLATYIGYGNVLTPSFALVEGAEISTAARFSVFSQVAEGVGYYTGLTVVNPGPASADIEFYTLRADGSSVGRTTLTLAPNQKVARLFRELLPVSFQQVEGWGFVRASSPVVAAVLFGSSNGYALASVPQQIPAGDFVPPAQTSGAITGVVRSGGVGLADVEVKLSGPVNTTITTESSGQFVFSRLPAGQYAVTASRIGAVIVPTQRNVTIDRQNVDGVDFTAGAVTPANPPAIDFITPVSAFVGNSAVSIRVLGTNFTPASVIRVNNQPIPTTFISSVELRAVIPSSSLAQPATLKVAADTPPPGGGISSLVDFAVNPVPSNPLIEGSAAVGSFPAGVAIDAVRRRALIANESGDSVTVLDLVTRQAVAEVRVGRSPGEGIDVHPGKDIALVANVGSNDVSVIDLKTNTVIQTIKVGRGPLGLAVNPDTNRAYVVNADDNNITVINLDNLSAIGTFSAGSRPSNIAVNPRTNQAIVSNRGGNSVLVLALASGAIVGTIPVGEFPRGVAINPETNRGVVANAGGDSISILDLVAMTAVTVKAGAGPTGVAIHQGTNSALVTNSGVTRDNPGLNGVSTVSVINLDTREEIASISAGSAAYGVGVDQDRQIAAVANFGSNNVTIIRIPNPVPKITGVEPKTFPTGGGSFVVTVRGTGFVPTSVITLNRQALPTVFVSTIELKGVVSAAMVDQLLQVRSALTEPGKGTVSLAVQTIEFNIEVENPGPGGGNSPPPSNAQTNQIQPQNPAPSLLSISPTETQAGVADLTLTLSGNNFNVTSIINFGGTQFSPVASSLQAMTIVVPKALLVAGTFPVSVTNPAPGGGLSALLSFTVNAVANPGPTVTTVTPSSVLAGSGAVTVVVAGTGFISSTAGTLAGVAGVLSGGTMSFAVPAGPTASVGTLSGLITNPAPGGGTATFSVNVLNPAPAVSSFTPTSAGVGASAISLQVSGTSFVPSSQVTFGGTPVATGFVSSSLLTATIPVSLLTAPGSFAIGVTNPAPGGGSAAGGNFTVRPAPTLLSISPTQGSQGAFVFVTLTGTNFVPGATTIAVSGSGVTVVPTGVGASSVSLDAMFAIDPTATPGPRSVTVTTAGGTSSGVAFTVLLAPPTLSSISPASGVQGSTVGVTFTGTGFVAGATVLVNSADVTVGPVTVVGPTSITTTFTISSTAAVGARSVTVSTSAGTSGAATFSVVAATPTLSSISPSSGTQGSVVGVSLTGTNFIAGSTVSINSADVTVGAVTVVNSSLITTTFTISPTAAVGTRSVTVFTSAGTSNAVTFSVGAGAPTLSSISPATGLQGAVVGVTLTGTNFIAGSTVSINSADVTVGPVTVVNSSSITTTLTISSTAVLGARNVTVSNSSGTSGAVTFTVGSAAPTLSSISPASGVQGAVVGVTLTGTNFIAGSTVSVNSADVTVGAVTVVNSTSITTTLTISATAVLGARNVTVSNSGGTSGAVTFTVGAAAPTLSSISPASGVQGAVVGVTLTGTNFIAGSTVSINSADVTVGAVTVVNSSSITTTLTISSTAVVGARNVTVSNSGGTSGAVTFSVGAAAPTLSSINIPSGLQGDVVSVTLTGTNFLAGATVAVSGTGVAVSAVNVVNSTTLTATFTISSVATPGARNVTVTTGGGTSGAVTFTVVAGANLFTGFSAAANPGGVWSYGSTPTLGGAFTLYDSNAADPSLPPGFQRWYSTAMGADPSVVRNNTGTDYTHSNGILFPSNMLHFHPGPSGQYSVIRWTAPATGVYVIQGAFFGLNPRPTTTDVHVRHNSSLDLFSANINNYMVSAPYNVIRSVVAGDTIDFEVGFGSNADYTFDSTGVLGTITPLSSVQPPSLSAISPVSGVAGTTTTVTLTGSNFVSGGTTVAVSGTGVTVGSVNVLSTTSMTASLTIAPTAATTARSVTVTTTGGTSNAQTFTIDPAPPTLTSVSPAFGVQGTAVPVTLTGTDFIAGASVTINSADVTVGPVIVVSPTSITTTLTIGSTAVVGIRNVTVATVAGTSNAQVFTVEMAGPVSWWRGEGNVSDTLGANNPSTSNAVSFVPAVSGTGFTFGSGGFIDIPPSSSLANQRYTLSAWARPNGPGPNNDVAGSVIINQNIDNTHALLVSWRALDGRFFFQLGTADGASIVSQNSFPTGQYYLVTATYDGSTFSLFVNGNLEGQSVGARPIVYSTNLWTIGAASPNIRIQNFPRTWNGVIDEVQVYSRALSTAEIQAIYFSLTPPTLTAISPSAGVAGQAVPVTLTGTNFVPGSTVNVSGSGVSAGTATVVSATSITTTLTIASGAANGTYNVTVTTPGGTTSPVVFTVAPTFPGSVFTGSVSTDWSNPANWLPGGVPTASTDVLVPASATRQPTLIANASVLNLTVENGATLNTAGFNLTVAGSVDAGTTITGTGTVIMSGTGTIKGTLPNVQVTGTATFAAASTATINGNLTVSSGSLALADAAVTVTGNFTTTSGGTLRMQNPAGVLTVNGATLFGGTDTTGLLTAGTLNVKGSFSSNGSSGTNFAASGTHLTVLNGTAAQTVSFVFIGATSNRFQNLQLSNTAGVVFSTNVQINGNFDVPVAGSVSGAGTLTVAGNLTTAAGSAITVSAVTLNGAMTVGGTFTPTTATFVGSSQTIQAGLGYQNVVLAGSGTATFSASLTVPGNLTVSSGSLDLAGMTVTVTGNFTTTSGGTLKMQNPAGVLTVNGTTLFGGTDTTGLLTAGTLNVKGSFSSNGSSGTNFAASGTHLTVLNGTAAQTVSFVFIGATSNRFQNLQLSNTAGVVFSTNVQINGNFDVPVAGSVSGAGTLTVAGNLTTAAGSAITVSAVTLNGAMTVGGTFTPATTTFTGASQTIQAGLGYQNVVLAGSGTATFSASLTVPGNLTVSSGSLDLAGMTVTVTGNFTTTSGGTLKMQNPAGVLTVNGTTLFGGTDTTGLLTAGTLNVKGSFSSNGSSGTNFAASGTHLTVLNGTAAQTVSFVFIGATSNRFQNLQLSNTAGVVFSTNVQINGNFDVPVAGSVSGAGTLTVAGNLTTAAGSAITVSAVTLNGAMTVGGTFTPATTTFTGASQTIQAGLGYQNVVLAGSGTATFSASLTVPGNLTVSSGSLDLAGMTVTVTGNFTTTSGGTLKMQNPAGVLTVNGATLFGGTDTTGLLTAGTLNVKGSFSSNGSSGTNFAASGTHLTVLNGTAAQTVSFVFIGATSNRFQNLQLSNTAGVVFSTNVQINGNFDVPVAGSVSGAGTLTVAGNLTTAAGSAITVSAVTLNGAMTVGGTFTPATTTFTGASQTIQAGLGYQNVVLAGSGTATFSASLTVPGNLTVSSGSLDLAGMTVTVTGNFTTTSGGTLKMQNPAGVLTVNGTTLFGGTDTTGLLTAGTLNVKGSFSSNGSSGTNFAASGTHLTVLNGTASQTVNFVFTGGTSNRFQNLQLSNTAGVVFSSNVQINGNFDVPVAAGVSGASTVTIVGNLTTAAGSAVTVSAVTLNGAMTVGGTFTPATTTFTGASQTIQAGLSYQNVAVAGTAVFAGATLVTGSLTVSSGSLDLAGMTVSVIGNFSTVSGGVLKMQNSAGVLSVNGATLFGGGSTTGLLTAGTLNVMGNFDSNGSSGTNFAASGTHLTILNGTAAQTVNFVFPGTTGNRFQDLIVNNTTGVSLGSNVVVAGELTAFAITTTKQKIIGNGRTLTVANIDVDGLDLDHVLLVINWNGLGSLFFDNVDLRNYPDPATRITITAAAVPDNYFSGLNFVNGVPTTGLLVNATDTNGGGDFLLSIESNLNPSLADARTVKSGGAVVSWTPQQVNYLAAVNYNVGTFSRSVDKGDFNGDGRLDLVVANRNTNDVSVLLGNGNGTFQTAVSYVTSSAGRTSPRPRFVKVVDLNLDGKPDLAVANENTNDISILLGNGNGTFQTAVNYATDFGPSSIAVGDFNGDGKLDLVVTNGIADSFADTVSILLGNGDGTLQQAANFAVGVTNAAAPRSVVVADFNADARQDLAVALGNDDSISVFMGNGNGTFQAAVNYATGLFPYYLVTSDFNLDGKPDLAVANKDDDTVKVYLGNGNGTFQAGVPYTTGSSPQHLTVADFNGDGVADLATADCGSACVQAGFAGVSVLLGNGDGTFQFPAQFAAGTSPFAVVGGDFNGDSKIDLAVANRDSNNLSILLWTP